MARAEVVYEVVRGEDCGAAVLCIVSQGIVGIGEVALIVGIVLTVGTLVALSFPRRRDPRFFSWPGTAGLG